MQTPSALFPSPRFTPEGCLEAPISIPAQQLQGPDQSPTDSDGAVGASAGAEEGPC